MSGILRKNIDSASATIIEGSSDTFVNGAGVVRVGDVESNSAHMIQGSSTVFVNGIAVCRNGDIDTVGIAGHSGSLDTFSG